jgi:hypothetical protein
MSEKPEQVLMDLQVNAVNRWFQSDPYIFQVYAAMPPADRASVIEKVRNDSIEKGFLTADIDTWLAHRVNTLYDEGKLPEVNRAQQILHQHVQAVEDHAIYHAPQKQVEEILRAQDDERIRAWRKQQPSSCRLDDDHTYPG